MLEMLSFQFIQRALIGGIIVGFVASFYGVFIVQRKMSFLGDGLSHSAFGGIALGLLLNTEPLLIAVPFTILVSIGIVWLREKTKLELDTSIGILFAVSMALGIIFLSLKANYTVDAFSYLFGSILAIQNLDIWFGVVISLLTIICAFKYWKKWAYASFDSELAKSDKHKVLRDDYILSVLTAVTIVISIKIVGIVLIAAFLVIPAAGARLVSTTFYKMTVISVIFGISSSILGLLASYKLDVPSGALIILVQALIFVIAALFKFLSKRKLVR